MSVSEEGVLATSQGIFPRDQRLTWRARNGNPVGTLSPVGIFSNLELSRDDSRVAVSAMMGSRTTFDIWVVDVATGTSDPVTSDPDLEFDPSWSPDEKRIGFISTRIPGRYSAYSRATDASGRDEVLIPSESSVFLNFWSRLGIGYGQGGQSVDPSIERPCPAGDCQHRGDTKRRSTLPRRTLDRVRVRQVRARRGVRPWFSFR